MRTRRGVRWRILRLWAENSSTVICGAAAAVLPIKSEGRVRGLFYVYARERDFFQWEEQALLANMFVDLLAGNAGFDHAIEILGMHGQHAVHAG